MVPIRLFIIHDTRIILEISYLFQNQVRQLEEISSKEKNRYHVHRLKYKRWGFERKMLIHKKYRNIVLCYSKISFTDYN
ncbi:protein of unknown function [Candidatus Nitrosocosmicus franklandus]|uniref:Uncharacterized protein n=1 Tax=Candidatus Nitrosocosmicus franklandianus TaxID=1798806 RepID=A0A484I4A8_9ARCH|nr:protein of unknown function [Candidatus Nitrosocosmicus franklandus]